MASDSACIRGCCYATGWAFGCTGTHQEHTRINARTAQPPFGMNVVGGSETAEAPNWYDYALRGRRELWVHDGSLRVGFFYASESHGNARRARRVGEVPSAYQ